MKSLLTIGIALTVAVSLIAQTSSVNTSTLLLKIKKSRADSNRVRLLLILADHYITETEVIKPKPDSALTLLLEANRLGEMSTSQKWRNESRRMIGRYYFKMRDSKNGQKYFKKIINELATSGNDQEELLVWEELSMLVPSRDTSYPTRINCFEKIITLCQRLHDNVKAIDALKSIADVNLNHGKLDTAEVQLFEVLAKFKAINNPNLHYTFDLLSVINRQKGDFTKALFYNLKSIESMEATKDMYAAILFYSRRANMYRELDQPQNSVIWYWKVFSDRRYTKPVNLYMFRDAGFLVRELIKLNRSKEALAFILDVSRKNSPNGFYAKASLSATLAFCYHTLRQDRLADLYYLQAIQSISKLENDNEVTADVNYEIGQFYFDRRQYGQAVIYLQNALNVSVGVNTLATIKDIHLKLYAVDSAQGKYASAIAHLRLYQAIKDSIFDETKSRQIEELGVQYQTSQRDKDIRLLNTENQLHRNRVAQANMRMKITSAGAALLLIIVGLLYNGYRLKQKSNAKLKIHQKEIDEKNISLEHLIAEQARILQDKEWLIKEVHHRVKNNLQMVISLLNTQSAYLDNDAAIAAIKDSERRIQAMALIHQKLYLSEDVSKVDMPIYINELIQYLKDILSLESDIIFTQHIDSIKLSVAQAVPIGLILNEAITNAIKYGFSDKQRALINISMYRESADLMILCIADNGRGLPDGFDYTQSSSLGMNLMRWLARQLGGSFEILNNEGVEVIIKMTGEPDGTPSQQSGMESDRVQNFVYD
ncbi:sensor histidine kinase [Flavitalea antarctica]